MAQKGRKNNRSEGGTNTKARSKRTSTARKKASASPSPARGGRSGSARKSGRSKVEAAERKAPERRKCVIGIFDPNSYSFRFALERLFEHLKLEVEEDGVVHEITTERVRCRPYDTLNVSTHYSAIVNRGAHWNPHHMSWFAIVATDVYLLNDMVSFKYIDKNVAYAQMHRLGLHIPPTWAIPQQDYSDIYKAKNVNPDLVFSEHDLFDLAEIGEKVGYPAYLKPQDGGGWIGVVKVNDARELLEAYNKSGKRPMNLQKAVEYKEFVRTVGVGPQMMPMHYNPKAEYSHDRYLRSPHQAVDFHFLTPQEHKECCQMCKLINAFYGWDHNTCEALLTEEGTIYAIDYANAYPDSTLVSLHFYFPDLVKAMVRWLVFCAVKRRVPPYDFAYHWDRFFETRRKALRDGWSYHRLLDEYEKICDEHFETEEFEKFCASHLADLDEKAWEFFAGETFDEILVGEIHNHFKIAHEIPRKIEHYRGIHSFWLHCERRRLDAAKGK